MIALVCITIVILAFFVLIYDLRILREEQKRRARKRKSQGKPDGPKERTRGDRGETQGPRKGRSEWLKGLGTPMDDGMVTLKCVELTKSSLSSPTNNRTYSEYFSHFPPPSL